MYVYARKDKKCSYAYNCIYPTTDTRTIQHNFRYLSESSSIQTSPSGHIIGFTFLSSCPGKQDSKLKRFKGF